MFSIFKKELWAYFGTLGAYVVSGLFLLICSLFLWFFDNDFNVFNIGLASLNNFFVLAPWILLFLIPADAKDYYKEYQILVKELQEYNPELNDKDRLIAISKSDLIDKELEEEIRKTFPKNFKLIFISAVTGENLIHLKDELWKLLHQ